MNYTILFTCTSVFCFIIAISYNTLIKHKNQKKRLNSLLKKEQEIIDEKLSVPFTQRFIIPIFTKTLSLFANMKPKRAEKSSTAMKLERDLSLAGIRISADEFSALKTIIAGGLIGLTVLVVTFMDLELQIKFLIVLASVILSILIPSYYLKSRIKHRQGAMRQQMPDVMDLLSVSIEAGLSFDGALTRLTQQTSNEITEEFTIMLKEIQMGRSRRDALKDLGNRNDIPELRVFVSSMIQAEQYGISIKNILREQAGQIRVGRRQAAEEKAMKAPVKMMLPIILFIFPVIFIILLAPAAMDILASFGGG